MFVNCDSVLVYLREVGCHFVSCSLKAKMESTDSAKQVKLINLHNAATKILLRSWHYRTAPCP